MRSLETESYSAMCDALCLMGEFYQTQSKYQANVTEWHDKLYGQKPSTPHHAFNMLYCALNLNVRIAVEAHTNGTRRDTKVYVLIHE